MVQKQILNCSKFTSAIAGYEIVGYTPYGALLFMRMHLCSREKMSLLCDATSGDSGKGNERWIMTILVNHLTISLPQPPRQKLGPWITKDRHRTIPDKIWRYRQCMQKVGDSPPPPIVSKGGGESTFLLSQMVPFLWDGYTILLNSSYCITWIILPIILSPYFMLRLKPAEVYSKWNQSFHHSYGLSKYRKQEVSNLWQEIVRLMEAKTQGPVPFRTTWSKARQWGWRET